eukprot:CAMPEP_0184685028 /NCGR_PEP_ID=MMETSP0312-20130426/17412_1 /TAXON_ID=31354 /ORGANISM="Compsopogon coeruleus, Strain SAG 36.94" /LENGTH=357 /DNA_ID=CAMNT_0027138731 /DNA_START=229 /DNA_END=1302 /DNA_ORIENTATION=-
MVRRKGLIRCLVVDGDGEFREDVFGDRGLGVGLDEEIPPSGDAPSRSWVPVGRLRDFLKEKENELTTVEEAIGSRPDHPLNLRLAFVADEMSMGVSRALKRSDGALAVIPQVKRIELPSSPDEPGERITDLPDVYEKTLELQVAGADAVLIHTDQVRYGCSLGDFQSVTKRMLRAGSRPGFDGAPPLIRGDFIFHPLQLAEAAELGANAVILIAGLCLPDLENLLNSAALMGLEAIVECHTELERDIALELGATILYLSNLDYSTCRITPGRALSLRTEVPDWIVTVAGGGIRTASECWEYLDAGFDAVVMGRIFMQTRRANALIAEIQSRRRDVSQRFFENFGFDESDEQRLRGML